MNGLMLKVFKMIYYVADVKSSTLIKQSAYSNPLDLLRGSNLVYNYYIVDEDCPTGISLSNCQKVSLVEFIQYVHNYITTFINDIYKNTINYITDSNINIGNSFNLVNKGVHNNLFMYARNCCINKGSLDNVLITASSNYLFNYGKLSSLCIDNEDNTVCLYNNNTKVTVHDGRCKLVINGDNSHVISLSSLNLIIVNGDNNTVIVNNIGTHLLILGEHNRIIIRDLGYQIYCYGNYNSLELYSYGALFITKTNKVSYCDALKTVQQYNKWQTPDDLL